VAEITGIIGWQIPEMPTWLASSRFANLELGNSKELPKEDQDGFANNRTPLIRRGVSLLIV